MGGVLKKTAIIFLSVIAAFSVVIAAAGYINAGKNRQNGAGMKLSAQADMPRIEENGEKERGDMLENALLGVVGISSAENTTHIKSQSTWNMGSGVMATRDGYIITNQHVVGARPQRIAVTLINGKTVDGKTVWSDSTLDLAVVKIDGSGYTPLKIGDAGKLRVGESIFAIGNPLSMQFERTVTAGIVSATGRGISIENGGTTAYMEDLIQTDASINPGNSGGPLINTDGEVVGINTIKVTTAEGMGFAVPAQLCVSVINRIKNVGEFKTPYLGISVYTPAAARYFGEKTDFKDGLFVSEADADGPAFAAGIRSGDIIKSIDGESVGSMLEMRLILFQRQPGETVSAEFERDGALRRIEVMLAEKGKQ